MEKLKIAIPFSYPYDPSLSLNLYGLTCLLLAKILFDKGSNQPNTFKAPLKAFNRSDVSKGIDLQPSFP